MSDRTTKTPGTQRASRFLLVRVLLAAIPSATIITPCVAGLGPLTAYCEEAYTIVMQNLMERITISPDICHGKPCIRGLRYPVEVILELLSSGMTAEDILGDYEDLEREDILAALAFAARLSQVKRLDLIGA